VTKKGIVQKLGGKNQDKWQTRPLSLSAEELSWGNNSLLKDEIASTRLWHDPNFVRGFTVETKVKSDKTYCFAAESEEDRREWMDAINSMIRDNEDAKVQVEEDIVYERGTYRAFDVQVGAHRPTAASFSANISKANKKKKAAVVQQLTEAATIADDLEKASCCVTLDSDVVDLGPVKHGQSYHRQCTLTNTGKGPVAICILPQGSRCRWLSFAGAHKIILPGDQHVVSLTANITSHDANLLADGDGAMDTELSIFCTTAGLQNGRADEVSRSSCVLQLQVTGQYNPAAVFGCSLMKLAALPWCGTLASSGAVPTLIEAMVTFVVRTSSHAMAP
jgi:hypothetical protein